MTEPAVPAWRHVFWDMGGTMVDTYPEVDRTLAEVIRDAGHAVATEEISRLTRRSTGEAITTLSARFALPAEDFRAAERALKQRWQTDPPPVMAGLHRVLKAVPGLNLVVTHRDRASADSLLSSLGIEVDDMVCTSDGFARKPDPGMYLELIQRHGLEPRECVGIGDRPLDVRAAQAAGMSAVMLETPGIEMEHTAEVQINYLSEFLPYLRR